MESMYCLRILCVLVCLCHVFCDLDLTDGSACVSEGLNGTCVSVYRCQIAAFIYTYRNAGFGAPDVPELPEICSFSEEGTPIVCCTDCTIHEDEKYKDYVITVSGTFIKKLGPKAYNKCMDYFQYLPYLCRAVQEIRLRIHLNTARQCHSSTVKSYLGLGGRSAARWELPHMALLGYGEDERIASWLCGGSVISERFILTAAHCVYTLDLGPVTFAALGILKRSDPIDTWRIYKIKTRIRHPSYKPPTKYNDIALLETEMEINFGRNILPACLDTLQIDEYSIKDNADAPGWGESGHKNDLADNLQVMSLEKFNDTECAMQFPVHRLMRRGFDPATQMCYGAHNEVIDTCHGDSGGPLHIDELNCLYKIIGVTSFGSRNCGILGAPGIFTRVLPYVPWIESIVWPD